MLMATHRAATFANPVTNLSQKETAVSDMEILRRVRAIRSQWTIAERIHRRQAAQQRFSDLLSALDLDCDAA